jgi:hypothetical protein
MKNDRLATLFVLALLSLPAWAQSSNPADSVHTFTGEIMDSICSPSGSHTAMMGKNASMGHDKGTCTKQCARLGGKYVLYDPATRKVYSLDNQTEAGSFAGREVRITGTLAGENIRIASIAPAK